ncbi:AbrB/MazE/SpoVT family DNA-binding domain-containing protein, partial [Vibrio parahaemolyticus]|nr:AbrB/MazE/SpoVT family DNA-binding domain-containing protein [Vibrio parahaemolyticus]
KSTGGGIVKSTGIVRKVDELGRIVIPIELRRTLNISVKDPLEIFVEDDKIILRKFSPSCTFCNETKDVIEFKGKNVCPKCIEELTNK